MRHKIMRAFIFLFGYPSQDWPPGKEALKAYDADYALRKSGKPVTYHPFLEDPVTVYPKVKS